MPVIGLGSAVTFDVRPGSPKLSAGPHVITAQGTFIGVPTRMVPAEIPFLACIATIADKTIDIYFDVAATGLADGVATT